MPVNSSGPKLKKQKKNLPTTAKHNKAITLIFVIAEFFLLTALYTDGYSVILRVLVAVVSLIITGMVLTRVNGLSGDYGIYIYGGGFGINTIEKLASRCKTLWVFFSEWGLVMSFGLLSYLLFPKRVSKKALLLGELSIIFLILFILPYFLLSFQFINIPNLASSSINSSTQLSSSLQLSFIGYVLLAAAMVGGFSFFIIAELLFGAWEMISAAFSVISSIVASVPNYTPLSTAIPGIAPVIPGITIPLFAGILSLALILIVHEFSHGVLSRIYKIKIKKVGLALFGVLPIGAFVEPDEKKLKTVEKYKQNNIFIAGISANFLLTFIFFIIAIIFLTYITPTLSTSYLYISGVSPGTPAYNVITPGSIIQQWNGVTVNNISALESAASVDTAFSKVTVTTNNSTYTLIANETGKIGVFIGSATSYKTGIYNSFLLFLYQFVILSLVLNFLVAVINLLPLPMFDGWRIYKNLIKNEKVLKLLTILLVVIFILLLLPWFFIL